MKLSYSFRSHIFLILDFHITTYTMFINYLVGKNIEESINSNTCFYANAKVKKNSVK